MLKKIILSALCITTTASFSSFAFVMGGSNLPLSQYPSFTSYYSTYNISRNELEQLRWDVERYIENGNNDIKRIQEAQRKAIQEYNDAVQAYNMSQQYY